MIEADPALKAEWERLQPRYEAADAIIAARYERGLSQRDLAKLMGVSQPVVARLESAEHSPRIDSLAVAAMAMGLRVRVVLEPLDGAPAIEAGTASERRVAEEPCTYDVSAR
ncbi:MAG: XRE family transcriptional regulator [Dehalococcoidia bacterium]|nr:XRE family transcriptional regulator [Dehalococcoidia bacterium]